MAVFSNHLQLKGWPKKERKPKVEEERSFLFFKPKVLHVDNDFVELFNDLTKEMENMDDQVIGAGYANFNNEKWTSEINADKVDWRGASTEASTMNILLKGKWKC